MNKKEFDLEKELIELKKNAEIEIETFRHKNKIRELNLAHEQELERGRIKSAEIRKNFERKKDLNFMQNYSK
jgi:hypothetical protein